MGLSKKSGSYMSEFAERDELQESVAAADFVHREGKNIGDPQFEGFPESSSDMNKVDSSSWDISPKNQNIGQFSANT